MIKNLLFDLGGVLLNIDFKKLAHAFELLGVEDFDKQFSQLSVSGMFEQFEMGEMSNMEFYREMIKQTGKDVSEKQIRDAWNAILLNFRTESMQFLVDNKNEYRIFLLSNTNDIHLQEVNKLLFQQLGVPSLDDYFEKAYYSQEIGMRKPYENIYQFVLKDAGIKAAETFFVDDIQKNIDAASKMGFKTHLLLPGERIENLRFE